MAIKSILVPLDGSERAFHVLETALIVANRFGAQIKAVHVKPGAEDLLPYEADYLSAKLKKNIISEAQKKNKEEARSIHKRFNLFCKEHHVATGEAAGKAEVSAVWHEESGDTIEVLVRHGRLCDVVATFRPSGEKGRFLRAPAGEKLEALMLRAGRPILMVPPKWSAHQVEHAAFAWNESVEASRALAMTMPWLKQMGHVTILVSRKRKDSLPDLRSYLSLHEVKSKVKFLPEKTRSVGAAMLACCKDEGVEFLVVGGFSHARSRQLIFGGVTKYLLANTDVITVMAH